MGSPDKLFYKLTTDFIFYIALRMIKALVIYMQALWLISEAAVLTDIDAATISEEVPAELLDNPAVQAGIINILTNPDVQKAVLDVITNKEVHKQVGDILKNIFEIAKNISKGVGDILIRPLIPGLSQQTGLSQRTGSQPPTPTNMLDIVKNLDLETLIPATTNTTLQAIVQAVKDPPMEELVTFSDKIENDPNTLKEMFGLQTTNPVVLKLINDIVSARIKN